MDRITKGYVKSIVGGFSIGVVTRLVLGANPVTLAFSTCASLAWGVHCAWEMCSEEEKSAVKEFYQEWKAKGFPLDGMNTKTTGTRTSTEFN